MTLGQLIEACEFRTGYRDSAYTPRWISFINEAVREFARLQPWQGLEDKVTLQALAGAEYLVLPHYVDTVVGLVNFSDTNVVDREGDFDRRDTADYVQGTVGRVFAYEKAGDVAVIRSPVSALWFRSDHASDVHAVYVTGLAATSGASGPLEQTYKELAITATGTSPITLSTLFTKIISISKSTDSRGAFFFFDAGADVQPVAYMGPTDTESRFKRLKLFPIPDTTKSLELRYRARIPLLRATEQAPHPAVKDDFVVSMAASLHWGEQQQVQKQLAMEAKANKLIAAEAHKDRNFDEPYNAIQPNLPFSSDESDDYYSGNM